MKNYKNEFVILLIQLFMFYIFPFFTGPTDGMGMVFVIWLSTIIFSMILVILSDGRIIQVSELLDEKNGQEYIMVQTP